MNLAYAICKSAVAPIRAEPSHRSEMSSQLLFGERVIITELEEKLGWARVIGEWDEHTGWVKQGQLQLIDYKLYRKDLQYLSSRNTDALLNKDDHQIIPLGSSLLNLRKKEMKWFPGYTFKGAKLKIASLAPDSIIHTVMKYIGAPYVWGGRTIMGIDCSGLTQMVYKMHNYRLFRNVAQQVDQGEMVDFLADARTGDLAYFDNEDGIIVHVGILLDEDKIIHATELSGSVVIDKIDNGGIISYSQKKRTHKLRVIKRIML